MLIEEVDASACRMWHLHERLGEEVNAGTCASLIDSVKRYGIKNPVLGRREGSESQSGIELIYGARRLFAAQQLGLKLPVRVCRLDDRAALIEMDIENRVRRDISPYERGISYRRWLNGGFFRNQAELASALAVSEAQVSRLLKYADLPAAVLSAFESVSQIREEWAVQLARRCQDGATRSSVIRRAREWARSGRLESPQGVYASLVQTAGSAKAPVRDTVVKDSKGKALLKIRVRSKIIHLIIPRDRVTDEVLRDITQQLEMILSGHGRRSGATQVSSREAAVLQSA